jgi:hypothetical protein
MGRKVTAFSDLSGAEVPEDELGRLVIRDHPDLDGPAVYLEALPNEVTALRKANVPMVTVEWQPPAGGEPQTFALPVADFDKLAKSGPRASFSTALRAPVVAAVPVAVRRSTTPRWSTPDARTGAGLARRKRHSCASTWTRSTPGLPRRVSGSSTPPTRNTRSSTASSASPYALG